MNLNDIDVVVVGGGSAGASAAAMAARNHWKVLVIDNSLKDGFLGSLGNVSFFPGYLESSSGVELIQKMRKQSELFGAQYRTAKVQKISADDDKFKISVGGDQVIKSRTVILASGAAQRTNYLNGERDFLGRGVSYDATVDGPIFSHRTVAVVGKNQLALDEAVRLTRFVDKVLFIVPSSKIDVSEAALKMLRDNKKIELCLSASLKKIEGSDHVNSISVFMNGEEKKIEVRGVFSYLYDYKAADDYLKDTVELAENGAVKVTQDFETSVKGIFACGDILCARPQLPAIASAQGVLAAMSVDKYLAGK